MTMNELKMDSPDLTQANVAKLFQSCMAETRGADGQLTRHINFDLLQETTLNHVTMIYFVAETKGSMSGTDLRQLEARKVKYDRQFFAKINADPPPYEVADGFGSLMDWVAS